MESASPVRRPWLRFGLSHLFVLTLGIALGFAPLKLWELNVRGQNQILAHVKAIEIPQNELAQLGFASGRLPSGGIPLDQLGKSFSQRLEAMRLAGQAKVLADPTLATVSGRRSSFNIGGEVPVPIATPDGNTSITYRPFGTRIDLMPTLLRNGRIQMEIASEISLFDSSTSANQAVDQLPSLRTTSAESNLDMADGETVVVCANSAGMAGDDTKSLLFVVTVQKTKMR